MRTALLDTSAPANVAGNSRKTGAAPLVSTVAAGSAGTSRKKEKKAKKEKGNQPLTILDLVRQVAAAGVEIDRNSVGLSTDSDIDHDLAEYQENGHVTDVHCPETLRDMLSSDGGGSPASIVKGYFAYREARRRYCQKLQQFITAVEADDIQRDREEMPLLPLPKGEGKTVGARAAGYLLQQMTHMGAHLAFDDEIGGKWIAEEIGNTYMETCDRETVLAPCARSYESAAAFGMAIFGPDLVPDTDADGGHCLDAFTLAAIYLKASYQKSPAVDLLQMAAIVTQEMVEEGAQSEA
ncbi:MAG: hypothetical protein V4671_08695 [Armatimonadota bacterium]